MSRHFLVLALIFLPWSPALAADPPPSKDRVDCSAVLKGAPAGDDEDSLLDALAKVADCLDRRANKGQRLSEAQALAKIGGGLCHAFSENDFAGLQETLKNSSKRLLGREVPLEKAYLHVRCYRPMAQNCDLIRVMAEAPTDSNLAAEDLVLYFTEKTPNKALLGKIVRCRRDFGDGCVDVLEHIERNAQTALQAGLKYKARMLRKFKTLLLSKLDKSHLKRDRSFCRQFLDEPRYCE